MDHMWGNSNLINTTWKEKTHLRSNSIHRISGTFDSGLELRYTPADNLEMWEWLNLSSDMFVEFLHTPCINFQVIYREAFFYFCLETLYTRKMDKHESSSSIYFSVSEEYFFVFLISFSFTHDTYWHCPIPQKQANCERQKDHYKQS